MRRFRLLKVSCVLIGFIVVCILILLWNKTVTTCDLNQAIYANSTSKAVSLITQGISIKPCRGAYPIHVASLKANKIILEMLLKRGEDPNRVDETGGQTPIMWLVGASGGLSREKNIECFELLISSGADINASATLTGWSALHLAVSYRNILSLEMLLNNGADINSQDKRGKTPLHTAVENENQSIVELLIKRGADTSLVDINNETPADIAKRMKLVEIENMLVN